MIPMLRVFDNYVPALNDMKRVVARRDEIISELIEEHRETFDPKVSVPT